MGDIALHSWENLEKLPGTDFYRLYKNPTSALAIFRKRLSSLAKSFVMFLLYLGTPIPVADLELMVKSTSLKEKEHALKLLHDYHIFKTSTTGVGRVHELTKNFARSLREALEGGGKTQAFGQIVTLPRSQSITIDELDTFARQQWEGILGYMVGSSAVPIDADSDRIPDPSPGVIRLLEAGHLIELSGTASRGYTAKITKEGFAFVLQDVNTQVWALLFLYVDIAEEASMSKVDVLSFLFLVSSMDLGLAYSTAGFSETQLRILADLEDFGIVYRFLESNPPAFYPTRLATTLTSPTSSLSTLTPVGTNTTSSFIILETNFRLYAYTSSSLQIALLALFTTLRSRHPNLVTAKLTKSSVQRAVQAGITADQMIAYLASHAHPQMRRNAARTAQQSSSQYLPDSASDPASNPNSNTSTNAPSAALAVLPATVTDQIHLWQLERDRMATTPGYLLKEFNSDTEWADTKRYADEIGVLVWSSERKKMFFVSRIEQVQAFMRDRRERIQGQGGGGSGG